MATDKKFLFFRIACLFHWPVKDGSKAGLLRAARARAVPEFLKGGKTQLWPRNSILRTACLSEDVERARRMGPSLREIHGAQSQREHEEKQAPKPAAPMALVPCFLRKAHPMTKCTLSSEFTHKATSFIILGRPCI